MISAGARRILFTSSSSAGTGLTFIAIGVVLPQVPNAKGLNRETNDGKSRNLPTPQPRGNCAGRRATPLDALRRFFQLESAGGILLVGAAVIAMIAANSPLATWYEATLRLRLSLVAGDYGIDKPLLLWVNDGLMALFFFMIGLELKREALEGELREF